MTIKDIARECGCAVGTVSRVLNNHPDVSDKTREKVLSVVNKYDFVLNTNAKQLKKQDRKNLVIIVKGSSSILLNSLMEKIQKRIEPLDYNTNVFILDESDNEGKFANRIYYELKPSGIIFLGGTPDKYLEDFEKIKVPSVLISNQAMDVQSSLLSSVSVDNFKAAFTSAKYLLENGHKKIGVIGGNIDDSEVSRIRFEGFLEALLQSGISFDFEKSYESSKFSFEGASEAVEKLVKNNPEMTAIFTMSDAMAIGACRKLQDLGVKVPDDISIIGFDGINLAEYFCPRITTIKQLENELVNEGIDVLLQAIENGEKPIHKLVPFSLIKGESVKKIN